MFGENGFCNYDAHTAWPTEAHNRGDDMDKQDNQVTHAPILAAFKTLGFHRNLEFARDSLLCRIRV
jgi:hypothetical protein